MRSLRLGFDPTSSSFTILSQLICPTLKCENKNCKKKAKRKIVESFSVEKRVGVYIGQTLYWKVPFWICPLWICECKWEKPVKSWCDRSLPRLNTCVQPCCLFRGCSASLCGGPRDGIDLSYLHSTDPQKRGAEGQPQCLWQCRSFSSCYVVGLPKPLQLQAQQLLRLLKPYQTPPHPLPCCLTGNACLWYHFDSHKISFRRLNTSKTEPLRVGQPYTLSCHVGDHLAEVESCSWQFGSGPQIPAPRPGSTGDQQPREGTISQSSKSCNLTLHSLGLEHMGTWTCR